MTTCLLVDIDTVVYQIACGGEQTYDWGDVQSYTVEAEEAACARLDSVLIGLRADLFADDMIIAMTDDANFRKAIYPAYKSNRKAPKPALFNPLRKHLNEHYHCYQRPGLEADDILGILSTAVRAPVPGTRVVVSEDKDLRTIPGLLYNPRSPALGVQEISAAQADYWHLYQTLIGDACDGYPGCPGIGPKKAAAALSAFSGAIPQGNLKEAWGIVVDLFASKGLTEEDALIQARMARILRASDYCFQTRTPKPWTPPA